MKRVRGSLRAVAAAALTLILLNVTQVWTVYGETGEKAAAEDGGHSFVWIVVILIVGLGAAFVLLNDHFYKKNKRDREERDQKRLKIV